MPNMTVLDELVRRAEQIQAQIEAELSRPDDDYDDGVVIVWKQTYASTAGYDFCAIKYRGRIWRTSQGKDFSWSELCRVHLSRAEPGTVCWASQLTEVENLP